MARGKSPRSGQAIHYFPIIAVMLFWLGSGLVSSLLVTSAPVTRLGIVTLPVVLAAAAAALRLHRRLKRMDRDSPEQAGRGSGTRET